GMADLLRVAVLVALACMTAVPARAQAVAIAGRIGDESSAVLSPPGPTPRLPDGHPDLGNGKGSWNPRVIANLAGTGDRSRSPVERVVDVPFQPWSKGVYEE